MHSSRHAASTWSSLQPSQRANRFSFPPTQRTGLLVSPTAFSKDERADRQEAPKPRASLRPQKEERSVDQGANLKDSFRRMLDALNGPVRNSATA